MKQIQRWGTGAAQAALLCFCMMGFIACGGGGGGNGGGGGGSALLESMSQPSFGTMGATTTTQSFNSSMSSSTSLVGPTNFANAAIGDANFIEFTFSETVSEASIANGGIVVRGSDNLDRSFFLDKAGAIDATNTFTGDEAERIL